MFVEGLSVRQALRSLLQRVEADEQIRHEINQQQLPGSQCSVLFDQYRCNEQHDRDDNFDELFPQAVLVVMFVLVFVMMFVVMFFHNNTFSL